MGRHHVRHWRAMPGTTLVAVCDVNAPLALEFATEAGCAAFTDVATLLAQAAPEIVSIIAPTSLHFSLAEMCLQSGAHVFIEKPIAATVLEADALIHLAREENRLIGVGHIERFNPAFTVLNAQILAGAIGVPVSVEARRASPMPHQIRDANVLVDLAVHDIDLCNAVMQAVPTAVSGKGTRSVLSDRDDAAHLFLTYPKGSASINVNWLSPVRVRELLVTGSTGWAKADLLAQSVIVIVSDQGPVSVDVPPGDALGLELASFLAAVQTGTDHVVTGQAARDVLAVALSDAIEH